MATAAAQNKTASTHRTAVFSGTHQLDILGYTTRRHLGGADGTVRSRTFDAGGFLWTIVCRFHQNMAQAAKGVTLESISLELSCNETDEAVVATASVRIDDPSGTGRWPAAEWRSEEPNVFPARSRTTMAWELAVPDAFRDNEARYADADADCLTVHCNVDVYREESAYGATTRSYLVALPPPPSLGRDIRRLREEKWWPDVTFSVDETKIQAHRLVLAMRSPVFAAEFRADMKEKTMRCIKVVDMSTRTFRAMLHFIYADELPKPKTGACRVAMARDLLVAADLYDLERLRLMCENILSENIDTSNVMATLMLVHNRHSCHRLEASCVEYMASGPDVYEAMEATEEYKELDKTCPSFINEITKKVAKRAVARNRSPSSSSSSGNNSSIETASVSRYNPSEVTSGTHEFRIECLSVIRKTHGASGQFIRSGSFQVGGHEWAIDVYLSGEEEEDMGYIAIFLALLKTPATDVKVSAFFRLDDRHGKSIGRTFTNVYTKADPVDRGLPTFTTMASANSRFVAHDGSLTVHCRLEVTTESCTGNTVSIAVSPVHVPPSSKLASHLEELLASEKGWDVKFLVEESEIHAHGLVVATRSPALHELVESATGTDYVRVDDGMKASTFKAMLHFIYTDELPRIDDLTAIVPFDAGKDPLTMVVGEMLAAACRFRLERMRRLCENLLAENITPGNALATLELAGRHGCAELEGYCIEYISLPHVVKDVMKTFSSFCRIPR
uniref:Uncharacterized protein n=1 Tax=Avena sativa TaxID=4498 RepID=A0ACD5W6Y1_AVESA